jgi:6-phosphofructokinase 1
VYRGIDLGFEFVGIQEGWRGLVKANYEPLGLADVEEIIYQGGTMLGSSRTNPFKNPDDLNAVLANIKSAKFDAIVACGGEDTLGVAAKLYSQHGVPTVGVPKTMDNDLSCTDFTFGLIRPLGLVWMQSIDYATQHGHTGVSSSWKSWDAMQDGLPGTSVWQAELIG